MKKKLKKLRKKTMRRKKRRVLRSPADAVWKTTCAVDVSGDRTIAEFLSERGVKRPTEPGRAGATALPSPEEILRVEGGNKYELGRMVAKGGMGVIREVRDVNCRRTVAMKVLQGEDPKYHTEDLLRFIEEAQITSQLEHPNIVPVHELGLDATGRVFYTMKFVKGATLTDVLDSIRKGKRETTERFPLSRLLNVFQKTCDAVAFAHSRGVVHRDLKPDNIMIGDYGEVLVMDWGLAKTMTPPASGATLNVEVTAGEAQDEAGDIEYSGEPVTSVRHDKAGTGLRTMSGRIMGTPGFMAPEQTRPQASVDTRSDIYSLGSILYAILTLRPPVDDKDLRTVIRKVRAGDIVPPVMHNQWVVKRAQADDAEIEEVTHLGRPAYLPHCPGGQVPPALSDVAMKAMATIPVDRYPSVKSLQRDVEAYQDGLIWNLVVDEDFSSPELVESRWEISGGQWEIQGGEFRIFGGEPQFLLLKRPLGGDVRVEFECHQESVYLNDVACFIGAVRSESWKEIPASGYEFKYGGYSNSVNMLMRCDKTLWSESASPIVRGKRCRVRAERVGSRLTLSVNGEEVFRVTDPDPLSGPDRTAVGVLGWMADTWYSRIRVYSLGTPWKTDLLVTADRHLQKGNYVTAMDLFQEVIDSLPDAERLEAAQRGHETARNRNTLLKSVPGWRERLDQAWPDRAVDVRMDNDGLTVDISNRGLVDLAPLRGLPLTSLYCSDNQITSLEPLRGMPLVTLNCGGNPITSLEPLRGMPLNKLICEGAPVESLAPLKGLPLSMLNCGGSRLADGVEPLKGMRLTWLSCWNSGIKNLEPLRGVPLTALYCDGNEIASLEPLRGMSLGSLLCAGNRITDLEPLRGMPLTTLHCGGNRITDLDPLRGMPLSMFSCHSNLLDDLAPLRGLPLGSLTCGNNHLESLEPFVSNPPYSFLYSCDSLPTDELERALKVWSGEPRFQHHARNAEVLLALRRGDVPALRKLAAEFQGHRYLFIPIFMGWKEAKEFCEKRGGHLLTITTREENNFVASLMPGGSWFWLGLVTTGRGHEWVTGEPFEFGTFNDLIRERKLGEKLFCSGTWSSEVYPGVHNSFMIEWDS